MRERFERTEGLTIKQLMGDLNQDDKKVYKQLKSILVDCLVGRRQFCLDAIEARSNVNFVLDTLTDEKGMKLSLGFTNKLEAILYKFQAENPIAFEYLMTHFWVWEDHMGHYDK